MRAKAGLRALPLFVDSAGTADWRAGEPCDARMLRAAARRGYDLSVRRARQLALSDYRAFDYFLAMDLRNQADALAMAPPGRTCDIRLFLDFVEGDVPREAQEPYGADGFERALDLIEAGAEAFLDHLERDRE